ncbi:MAG TPA: murein transglycosylase A [Methylophilaceae bacterium]|nr:murein transglycosylase A [Methylophilaceae bacterium]
MNNKNPFWWFVRLTLLVSVGGLLSCASHETQPKVLVPPSPPVAKCQCDCPEKKCPSQPVLPVTEPTPKEIKTPEVKAAEAKIADYGLLKPASWDEVDGFSNTKVNGDNLNLAWPAWLQGCTTLVNKPMWQGVCNVASQLSKQTKNKPSTEEVKTYFKQNFSVYKTTNVDGSDVGLITGYYEPLLKGSRTKSAQYPHPLYTTPNDLVTVELNELFPELKFKRVRGRVVGNKLVPYYTRAEIEASNTPLKAHAFVYIDDIIDVFYLQVQGSGLVQLDNGEEVHVGYADQNGHTYNSIGRLLVERGELTYANASMAGIKNWAKNNPAKLRELLNNNPSYVFFRELPAGLPGPLGALGVPILAERVVAVDPKFVPLGAPVLVSTTEPNSSTPLKRLMMAQDTGGAIKGGVRADYYWGSGPEAGAKAGAMKQEGKIWVFLPKDFVLPPPVATP